jgi:uncharacterized RDD family membrane protein YckC
MRHAFETASGPVEIIVDEESRTVSAYRFDAEGRAVAAGMGSWDHADLADLLARQIGLSPGEAEEIASRVQASGAGLRLAALQPQVEDPPSIRGDTSDLEHAGLVLRFVALLLDSVIVFFPLAIVVGLLYGGGYRKGADGSVSVGVVVDGLASWAVLALALGYYILCEAVFEMTLGKRIVGIRVAAEDGEHVSLGAAVVRNLLRLVDGLFFYLVGALFVLTSSRGQRLGDRAGHTLVVRRSPH